MKVNFDEKKFRKDTTRIFNALLEVLVGKQIDYGTSFKKNWKRYGPICISTRLDEKMDRLRNLLLTGNKPNNESVRETIIDIIGYGFLGILELDRERIQKIIPDFKDA